MAWNWNTIWTISILLTSTASTHVEDSSSYDSDPDEYDYIIIGGGTAGCPLAATLSQRFKVLLLERGGSPYGNPNITSVNNVGTNLANQGSDTPVQGFVSTDGVPNERARVLGGGTSINYGFYNRASPDEVRQIGLDGLLANSSFRWVERVVASIRSIGPYQTAFRNSLLEAGVLPDNGASFDFHPGTQTGATIFDDQGTRRPASNLIAAYANPNNLLVLLYAEVELILFEGSYRPRARGVRYKHRSGRQHTVFLNSGLKSEIILCAGTLGSPQLLLLSGIGPADELGAMGINVKVNLPTVGKDLSDNPATPTTFPSPPPPVDYSVAQVVGITGVGGNYIQAISGGTSQGGLIMQKTSRPFSEGKLVLKSRNVTDTPIVTFNYFQNPRDLESCIAGVNKTEEVMRAPSFRRYLFDNQTLPSGGTIGAPNSTNPAVNPTINATLARYCRDKLATNHHYHGGCVKGQVLDSDYKVLGTEGLRVIDASTFQFSPGTNPQATVMMLGRYMGVKILEDRS